MHVVTARVAARILGITTDALYRRVHSGEIPTVDPGEELQPSTGHREYAFDRDVIAGMELRGVGRPRTYDATECLRTFVRVRKRELQAWQRCARKHGVSVGEWMRAIANAEARRATLKLSPPIVRPGANPSASVWVRSSKTERRLWQVAASRHTWSTNQWLRYIANAAAE